MSDMLAGTDTNPDKKGTDIDPLTGRSTTGHSWDGITELNTPLPRWWLTILYASIIWSIGYWIVYPAWPLVSSYTRGVFNYSSRAELGANLAQAEAARNVMSAGLVNASVTQINSDAKLKELAVARGRAAFGDNCAGCHGAGGQGGNGYPSIVDDDWLWGGTLEEIHMTLQHGIRAAADADTRMMAMPAYGRDGLLGEPELKNVASYVRSLTKLAPEAGTDVALGKTVFVEQCASCHGENGQGNKEFGAPALNDAIWLYGSDVKDIRKTLYTGRGGVMPNWAGRLDPVTLKALAVYVHALGGGQ
jgi:cytochrome c oxidase cbb3-type subunit III